MLTARFMTIAEQRHKVPKLSKSVLTVFVIRQISVLKKTKNTIFAF